MPPRISLKFKISAVIGDLVTHCFRDSFENFYSVFIWNSFKESFQNSARVFVRALGVLAKDFSKSSLLKFFRKSSENFFNDPSEIPSVVFPQRLEFPERFFQRFMQKLLRGFFLEVALSVPSKKSPGIPSEIQAEIDSDIPPGTSCRGSSRNFTNNDWKIYWQNSWKKSKQIHGELPEEIGWKIPDDIFRDS